MRVNIPHSLGRDEARHRLRSRAHELGDMIPGGMAEVTSSWPSEDRLDLAISAMGQSASARIDIADAHIALEVNLPPALSFVEPMVRSAIEAKGRKLLT